MNCMKIRCHILYNKAHSVEALLYIIQTYKRKSISNINKRLINYENVKYIN